MAKSIGVGSSESLHVYHDDFFENAPSMISNASITAGQKPARRPLHASSTNIVFSAPTSHTAKQSPLKTKSKRPASPLASSKSFQENRLSMVPMMPPTSQPLPTDSIQKKQPPMSRFKTVAQKPAVEKPLQSDGPADNTRPLLFPGPPTLSFENYYQKPAGKRTLMDAAPIKEARPAKPRPEDAPLPAPDSFPAIVDDGNKPSHSYATLIGMAILRAPNRRLTLSQIYKWISDTYSFYHPQDAGWQNSIRHNLSLNKHFVKQERPKDDPGKGNYWAIEAGAEHVFIKEKPGRRTASLAENVLPPMPSRLDAPQPLAPMTHEPILPPQLPIPQALLPALPPPSAEVQPTPSFPAEVSSDATIPVSDMAGSDELIDNAVAALETSLYSPLPVTMHSSPPVPRRLEAHHNGTPPPMRRLPGSSASKPRSHKRKFASMDDSGYISSLESSIMRPAQKNRHLATETGDRPRIKPGRAEEEIARLRSSSYDSPSKGRCYNGFAPPSSSPLRQTSGNEAAQMPPPPLTPAVRFKVPPKPPPSVSPNTNLRIHRDKVRHMLESPLMRALPSESDPSLSWSPALKFDDFLYTGTDLVDLGSDPVGFDIFQDASASPCFLTSMLDQGSPAKRSAKRVRLDRSHSTSALGELRNSASHKTVSASLLKTAAASPFALQTPSKAAGAMFDGVDSSPAKLVSIHSPTKIAVAHFDDENTAPAPWISMDDLCAPEMLDDMDELGGIDILSGFERIGSASQAAPRPARQGYQKPPLGRSQTSIF